MCSYFSALRIVFNTYFVQLKINLKPFFKANQQSHVANAAKKKPN